ncbi:hypothetical protein Scep_016222 [Stephania cephalantha]|uniref:Cyclic nucleotide-binding domain-containing protein n=1 Tax=Stephania cephalantha TaxID=152367 RepID=A0AAP0IM82_9MAGN
MATVAEGPLPYIFVENPSASSDDDDPVVSIIFFGLCMVLGIASRHLLGGTRVPYTVALLIIGIGLGSLEYGTSNDLGKIGAGIRLWANIHPDLLLAVFLPALLFESSFSMELHQIKRCIGQMFLLAGPGVLISTFCLGIALKFTFPYGWSWKTSLLLGGLLSATDPVAVVALLKELGASKKLSTIIEGESLMNDGTAIVVYQLFYRMVLGQSFDVGAIIKFLTKVSVGAVGIGVAFGAASVLWLGYIFNDTVIEIALTLAVSYIAYFAAQDGADVSGVLAVMTLGMFFSAVARTAFKGESQQSLHHFWEMVGYIANTLIFILSGVVIAEGILHSKHYFESHRNSWGYLILLYVFVQVSRIIVVGALFPSLRRLGYGLDWKEATILVWAGLRGAVALSLALSVKRTSDNSPYISQETGTLFVFFTGGIVFLTLIINGSTTQFVLHLLDMDKLSTEKRRVLEYAKYEMMNKAREAFDDLGDDEELGPADWHTVKRYIRSLNHLEGAQPHPHDVPESDNNIHAMNLKDIRVRLLNGVQAAYWRMLEEGRITQTVANILMQSVDEAIDLVSHEHLCDWKGLKTHVHFPHHYRFLSMNFFPKKLATYFTVERLELACYVCAAFLRGHRIARRQLHEFIGDSEIASLVIRESEVEGEEAKQFLEEVRDAFPQVLHVVKTKQVTYSILNHLSDYVLNLEKVGLLEEKEITHLHDGIQTDLKKLLRNPPLAKMPKIHDLINGHPLLGALPSAIREPLESSTKEMTKLRGLTIYKEGSKPNGIWLISNGLVKWTCKSLSNKHSLHPIFSHGSTLGLYEVLVGKPYICNIITDSIVHCFFVETEKILSMLRTDPNIEDLLWQESVIVIAKLLLPQTFEKMTMQEVRNLVVEHSIMPIYLSGEIIEMPQHSIGFLLEGYIKSQDAQQEMVTSPAVLLPSVGDVSFSNPEASGSKAASFCHQGFQYLVEGRARVIIFDMGPHETHSMLRRRSSSLLSHSKELPRLQSREHSGLMSWPELYYMQRRHSQHLEGSNSQLSKPWVRHSSYPRTRSYKAAPTQSRSYPRVPLSSSRAPQLVSVQSEGAATINKNPRVKEFTRSDFRAPLPQPSKKKNRTAKESSDKSSDESSDDNGLIVRIDSPSSLSFRMAS